MTTAALLELFSQADAIAAKPIYQDAVSSDPVMVYATYPTAVGKHTYRVIVKVQRSGDEFLVDLLMPLDGKPLGDRVRKWALDTYQAKCDWWPAGNAF
ncbi:MAG: hypothetical protein F6K04_02280 [Leptolyngbya sp. SIO4C5]|nr:hypothetical protein [Leptolyngbya sp. SIO4C5]